MAKKGRKWAGMMFLTQYTIYAAFLLHSSVVLSHFSLRWPKYVLFNVYSLGVDTELGFQWSISMYLLYFWSVVTLITYGKKSVWEIWKIIRKFMSRDMTRQMPVSLPTENFILHSALPFSWSLFLLPSRDCCFSFLGIEKPFT